MPPDSPEASASVGDISQILVYLDDIVVLLRNLSGLVQPSGRATFANLALTTAPQYFDFTAYPLFTLQIINDDPVNQILLELNQRMSPPIAILKNENIEFKFPVPIITKAWISSNAGTPTGRLIGLY